MRIMVLGGTRFIGRASVEELARTGHELLVVHRGQTEPPDFLEQTNPSVRHLHVSREQLSSVRDELDSFAPEAFLDSIALTGAEARSALDALPRTVRRTVVLSSIDVYRAYGELMKGEHGEPVPLDEQSRVREQRYPYRGQREGFDDYEKLDVEDAYLQRVGTVILRLPMVYGAHDRQRREEFILRRVRAGRTRIPIGAGDWLACRGYVGEMARAIRLSLEHSSLSGEILNLAEHRTAPMRLWAQQILDAADCSAQLIRVRDEVLPADMQQTTSGMQHLLTTADKARTVLGWMHADPLPCLRQSVEWHLAHPPEDADTDFEPDERALAQAVQVAD